MKVSRHWTFSHFTTRARKREREWFSSFCLSLFASSNVPTLSCHSFLSLSQREKERAQKILTLFGAERNLYSQNQGRERTLTVLLEAPVAFYRLNFAPDTAEGGGGRL